MNWHSIYGLMIICFATQLVQAQIQPSNTEEEYEKAYQSRIQKEYLFGVYIPKDLTDAFIELNRLTEKDDRIKFKQLSETEAVKKLHFSLGRWMIYNWGFYQGSRLSHYLKGLGIHHPDDMAIFIMLSYHRNLNRRSLNVKEQIKQINEKRQSKHTQKLKTGTVIDSMLRQRPRPALLDTLKQQN